MIIKLLKFLLEKNLLIKSSSKQIHKLTLQILIKIFILILA